MFVCSKVMFVCEVIVCNVCVCVCTAKFSNTCESILCVCVCSTLGDAGDSQLLQPGGMGGRDGAAQGLATVRVAVCGDEVSPGS